MKRLLSILFLVVCFPAWGQTYYSVNGLIGFNSGGDQFGPPQTIDSYSSSYINSTTDSPSFLWVGTALTLAQETLITEAHFWLQQGAGASGTRVAELYACTGTVGTNAEPTGSALATSDASDVTTWGSGTTTEITFTFSTPYDASAGDLCIAAHFGESGLGTTYIGWNNPNNNPDATINGFGGTSGPSWSNLAVDVPFTLIGKPRL